jgi:formate hydrogenlyase transcriptional activator
MSRVTEPPRWSDSQVQVVLRVLEAVSDHHDRERLFEAIAATLKTVFPIQGLGICLDGPGPGEMTPYFLTPRQSLPLLRKADSMLESVFETGEPIYVRSRADAADRPGTVKVMERLGMHSYVALPLTSQRRVLGALILHGVQPHGFDDLDLGFAVEVAGAIAIALDHCLAYESLARSRDQIVADNRALRAELDAGRDVGIVAVSPPMREVLRLVDLVAATDATVLILGETGAGKERVARAIHERSARALRPMIALNCAAIPAGLVESELFGHEAGAFTGATRRRRGRFELAHEGTLFLDEIGELPLEAQAKLLRVLQSQEVERLGGGDTIRVDVRVIAATNRDPAEMIASGRFRSDLYYRLAVFPIEVPPLSARRDDLPHLARLFIDQAARRIGRMPPHLDEETVRVMQAYAWPGNVRELQNVLERAVILSRGGILDVAALLPVDAQAPAPAPTEDDEAARVRRALDDTRWVIEGDGGAAAKLGLHPSTLRSRMRRFGIERRR